jgi:hypothetical protein
MKNIKKIRPTICWSETESKRLKNLKENEMLRIISEHKLLNQIRKKKSQKVNDDLSGTILDPGVFDSIKDDLLKRIVKVENLLENNGGVWDKTQIDLIWNDRERKLC